MEEYNGFEGSHTKVVAIVLDSAETLLFPCLILQRSSNLVPMHSVEWLWQLVRMYGSSGERESMCKHVCVEFAEAGMEKRIK